MPSRTYWLDLFTGKTWDELLAAGGEISGFRRTAGRPSSVSTQCLSLCRDRSRSGPPPALPPSSKYSAQPMARRGPTQIGDARISFRYAKL